jgi:hypothetical protein
MVCASKPVLKMSAGGLALVGDLQANDAGEHRRSRLFCFDCAGVALAERA